MIVHEDMLGSRPADLYHEPSQRERDYHVEMLARALSAVILLGFAGLLVWVLL